LPDGVIEKLGKTERVLDLWEKFRELKTNDYYTALSLVRDYCFEASEDPNFPLSESLNSFLTEAFDYPYVKEKVWELLEKHNCAKDRDREEYGSMADGVQRMADQLYNTQYALVQTSREKENAEDRLKKALSRCEELGNVTKEEWESLRSEVTQMQETFRN
jgi:hypothetical protein